jgi:hypothetical protein
VNAITLLRDVTARVVAAQEALTVGDTDEAFAILVDLEGDLVGSLSELELDAMEAA